MNHKILRYKSDIKEKIVLEFLPCVNKGENMQWEDWHLNDRQSLVIYSTDYNELLRYIKPVFPVDDPITGERQQSFDVCFDNWLDRKTCEIIVENILIDIENINDEKQAKFYMDFISWINEQLLWADIIVVEGNQ